jgi:hypothetical protein
MNKKVKVGYKLAESCDYVHYDRGPYDRDCDDRARDGCVQSVDECRGRDYAHDGRGVHVHRGDCGDHVPYDRADELHDCDYGLHHVLDGYD